MTRLIRVATLITALICFPAIVRADVYFPKELSFFYSADLFFMSGRAYPSFYGLIVYNKKIGILDFNSELEINLKSDSHDFWGWNNYQYSPIIDLRNFNISWAPWTKLKLIGGIICLGETEDYFDSLKNINDNHPKDWTNPIYPKKMGELALQAIIELGKFDLSLSASQFRFSRLYLNEKNPYFPEDLKGLKFKNPSLDHLYNYEAIVHYRDEPIDFRLFFYQGYNPQPRDGLNGQSIAFLPKTDRLNSLGLELEIFSSNFALGIKSAAKYRNNDGDSKIYTVIYGQGKLFTAKKFTIQAGIFYLFVDSIEQNNGLSLERHGLPCEYSGNAIGGNFGLIDNNKKWRIDLDGLVNPEKEEGYKGYLRINPEWKINKNFSVWAKGNIFWGPDNSYPGRFDNSFTIGVSGSF